MIRRLPVVLPPRDGESLPSWVDRQAAYYGVPRGLLVQALGLPLRNISNDVRPVLYGITASEQSVTDLCTATGLLPETVGGMLLSRFGRTVLDLTALDLHDERTVQPVLGREWANFHGSRACPRCLAQEPVWPAWWRLGAAAVCPRHAVLLVDVCPGCDVPLRRGYLRRPRGLSRVDVLDPRECGNYTPSGRCPALVDKTPAVAVPELVVLAQQTFLDLASGTSQGWSGQSVPTRFWATAMRWLTALVRFTTTPEDVHALVPTMSQVSQAFADEQTARANAPAGMSARLTTMPATAAAAVAILVSVHEVLCAANPDAAREALAPLTYRWVRRRRQIRHDPLRGVPCPQAIAAAVRPVTPGASRIAGAVPATTAPFTYRNIPHLISAEDYQELLAAQLPGVAARLGRQLGAVAIARLCGARSWMHAGSAIEADPSITARLADRAVRRVADPNAFWAAIEQIAARMASRELIDYAARRSALNEQFKVPHTVVALVGPPPVTLPRRVHAAAWVWQHLTGGDAGQAPAYQSTPIQAESAREGYRKFLRWSAPSEMIPLRTWATELLAVRGAR
ncbi:TniQ family protein [Nucisporomicrobium flavum]|uniref:TniQ family protein n=1 Tax=Nucisporomicrobium flavum TaxID=2785915 RepID=UPI0018F562FC|nr:TniQ family protein [Nucisporomicrobium flavum]